MNHNLPTFGELPSVNKISARLIVERILTNPTTFAKIAPFFNNGGVCGHKVMDLKGAVDVIRAADKDNELAPYHDLNDFKLGNVIKNALRSRYTLDKSWKISGLNPKLVLGNGFTGKQGE